MHSLGLVLSTPTSQQRPSPTRPLIAFTLLLVAFLVAQNLPIVQWLTDFMAWMRDAGPLGMGAYMALYIVVTALLLPATPLTLGSGVVYHTAIGVALTVPAATLGATLASVIGRTLVRQTAQQGMEHHPRFLAIDRAIQSRGLLIIILLRMSPMIPFNVLNLGLGVTQVRLRTIALGTAIGILPGTTLFVYLGSVAGDLTTAVDADQGPETFALAALGVVASIGVLALITVLARKQLEHLLGESPSNAN